MQNTKVFSIRNIHTFLLSPHQQKLLQHGVEHFLNYGDTTAKSWQETFSSHDPMVVETFARDSWAAMQSCFVAGNVILIGTVVLRWDVMLRLEGAAFVGPPRARAPL